MEGAMLKDLSVFHFWVYERGSEMAPKEHLQLNKKENNLSYHSPNHL